MWDEGETLILTTAREADNQPKAGSWCKDVIKKYVDIKCYYIRFCKTEEIVTLIIIGKNNDGYYYQEIEYENSISKIDVNISSRDWKNFWNNLREEMCGYILQQNGF